ncbi:MAG: toxin-activating lysine-acyltransferase [Alphaproteobacteria bacterium]|nr:toxin-activating lysine-acyltransferase [Alphaproteobacteria bacterium]
MANRKDGKSNRGSGAAKTDGAKAVEDAGAPGSGPEAAERIEAARREAHTTFGRAVLVMMVTPRYRHLSVSDLHHVLLEPLLRDRVAIATAKPKENEGADTLTGFAIWASVSEDVDAKIREQIRAGVFPVRLKPEDWTSGPVNWLLDVIAPNQWLVTAVTTGFRQVIKGDDLRVHPIVASLIGPDELKKIGATPIETDRDEAEGAA